MHQVYVALSSIGIDNALNYILSMVDTLGLPGDVIRQAQPVGSFPLAQNA